MKIQSLIREQDHLIPVDVEISFLPGLPQIQFLGLPDQIIKESIHRIKSAMRSQGFDFPKAQQVLVNIRPNHLKKSSRGLELAVAAGLLWETGQIPEPSCPSPLVYGELGLSGEVFEPEDLRRDFQGTPQILIYTGKGSFGPTSFQRACLRQLKDLLKPEIFPASQSIHPVVRPQEGLNLFFPPRQALLLQLAALGEHSLLLAGPAGSGKSTLAKTLASLVKAPTQDDMNLILQNNKVTLSNSCLAWRPVVQPHHSTSPLGLIGGGVPPFQGEISRAHKGLLILDELLEFHPQGQEALREPMEEGCIRIRRGRYSSEYPAQALVIATTNLCPCGDWVPQVKTFCARSLRKCQSYTDRLSGPLLDRFQMVFLTQKKETGDLISGQDILKKLEAAWIFREERAKADLRYLQVAGRWSLAELLRELSPFYQEQLFPQEFSSRRRQLATLRVARTLADLELSDCMKPEHIEEALGYTFTPFEALKRLGG